MKKLILKWLLGDDYEIVPKQKVVQKSRDHHSLIQGIMQEFDFERVHSVMDYLEWKWQIPSSSLDDLEVPSLSRIKVAVYDLLARTCDRILEEKIESYLIGSGGFEARAWYEDGKITNLQLSFVLAEWDEDHDY